MRLSPLSGELEQREPSSIPEEEAPKESTDHGGEVVMQGGLQVASFNHRPDNGYTMFTK